MLSLEDYNYKLPDHLIAQTPVNPPESCKFLVYDKQTGKIEDRIFSDITTLIDPDTLILFNNSKVVKARLVFEGLEIFYLTSLTDHTFTALVRPGKKFKVGTTIQFTDNISFTVDNITHEGRQLTCSHPILEVLEKYGQMPLPPYITYDDDKADPYQPVFAEKSGSVAAPTASLHFTKPLIAQLESQGIQTAYTTLHVGLGTFKQVDVEDIENYDIHEETCEIGLSLFERIAQHKLQNKPLLAVGTTVTRTLESLPYLWKILCNSIGYSPLIRGGGLSEAKDGGIFSQCTTIPSDTISYRNNLTKHITLEQAEKIIQLPAGKREFEFAPTTIHFETKLFLYPSKEFTLIDQLITNFHLPKSSLLMLVAGYIGFDEMKKIYRHAIDQEYRFYSFGDAMWLK